MPAAAPALSIWFAPRAAARSLRAWATWYQHHRPHQGLSGRTPEEVLRRRRPLKPLVIEAGSLWRIGRGRVDGERTLPIYSLRRAA